MEKYEILFLCIYALIVTCLILGARSGFHQLLMGTILMDMEQKKRFSKLLADVNLFIYTYAGYI